MFSIFLVFLILPKHHILAQETINIMILKESGQENLIEWWSKTLENQNEGTNIQSIFVDLSDESTINETVCKNVVENVVLALDLTWAGSDQAQDILKGLNLPYFRVDLSISPFLKYLDDYLDFRNSTDVAVIFDNGDYVDQSLYFWFNTPRLRLVISEKMNEVTAKKINSLRPTPNNYAILATSERMNTIFKQALDYKLVFLPERWNLLLMDFNSKNFDRTLLQGIPVNLLTLDEKYCCQLLNKDDCTCPENFNMQQFQSEQIFDAIISVIKNMITSKSLNVGAKLSCENADKFNDQTKIQFQNLLSSKIMTIDSIYLEDASISLKIVGTIERGSNISATQVVAFYDTKTGISEKVDQKIKDVKPFYRIGVTHAMPWSYKEYDENGKPYWTGYCIDFAYKLSEVMNFDLEFVEPAEGTFGKKIKGRWNGIIGDLARGQIDMAITAIIMTSDKEEVVDFVPPYFEQTGISIVMRKPVRKTSLFKFMTVLKLEVWLSIVGALIVTALMIWFLDKYSPYSAKNNKKAYPYPCREFTLKESFWFALTSFTPQGGGEAPKALSGRTLVAAYWLFVVLMLATFTANLAAFLTVERMQTPVQSLDQLARQSRINYTVVQNSETHKYFINMKFAEDTLYTMWKEITLNSSTDDERYRVWDYPIREQYGHILLAINDSIPVKNAAEGFKKVNEQLDADFAFIHDSSEIKYEISRNCNLTEVGEVFGEKPYAVAVQQGSHLTDDLSRAILTLQTNRFFEDLQAKYWNHSSKGLCPTTDDNEGISLESLGGVFIATLFGLALAMVTLAIEVFYYRNKRKQEEKLMRLGKSKFKQEVKKMQELTKSKLIKPETITIGTAFKPTQLAEADLFYPTLFPRARNKITHEYFQHPHKN